LKKVSFVIPVYNEESNLREFHKRMASVAATLPYDYEMIFVDDGSSDASAQLLQEMADTDFHVQAYLLTRNYGHQLALTCGLDHAEGDAVITMDGDLQHPPELVPELVARWEKGYQIVRTVRKATKDASFFKNFTSRAYYKIINLLSNVEITPGGSDFRLMDREAVRAFRLYRERARFIRGMVNTLGFRVATMEFVAPPRFSGQSKFNLRKMLHFALDGITAFSNLPLRWSLYLGLVCGLISLCILIHVLFVKFILDDAVPGWATLGASVTFLGGIQLIGIGILGEYIGRIFEEVKQRPLYLIARHITHTSSAAEDVSNTLAADAVGSGR